MPSEQPPPSYEAAAPEPTGAAQGIVAFAFRLYKSVFSPIVHAISPSRCLYLPTCSEYSYTALVRFGVVRGAWLSLRRLARCHPWGTGGFDPVPERTSPVEPGIVGLPAPVSRRTRANHLP